MTQNQIMKVVETIEKMIADMPDEICECEIFYDDIAAVCNIKKEKIDFKTVCMYAIHEVVTVSGGKGKEINYSLFKDMSGDEEKISISINPEARSLFKRIVED